MGRTDPDATRTSAVLDVRNLTTVFATSHGVIRAVDDVSFSVAQGEVLGVVGESGSGKSVTALSIMGLLPASSARIIAGEILLDGRDVLRVSKQERRRLRGRSISMIFQDPVAALNPLLTVGHQLREAMPPHIRTSRPASRRRALEVLDDVGVGDARRRLRQYPHELSGGTCQRVMIAMALASEAHILLADEPTTGLDVSIQQQVLELCKELRASRGLSLVLITHDMGVIADMADRVVVFYAGEVVEQAEVHSFFARPFHPYSDALIDCLPSLDVHERMRVIPGSVPPLWALPAGCRFSNRCSHATAFCEQQGPALEPAGSDVARLVRCHYWREIDREVHQ